MPQLDEPLRLVRCRGRWTLEVTKLVPVERDVLRPERRRVNGTDSVMRTLKERCAPTSVRQAMDLIVGDDDGTDRAFTLEGEHWVQLHDDAAPELASRHDSLERLVLELRAELAAMRALHEALRGRLAALERRALHVPPADYGRAALRGSPRPGGTSLRPGRGRSAHPPEGEAEAPVTAAAAAPATLAALGDARTQAAAQTPVATATPAVLAAPSKPLLVMPLHADLVACLKQLLGADPELCAEKPSLPKDLDSFYVSRIIDAADREMGAILLDLSGGVELGGRMLGFPLAAIAEQAKNDPSADMLDAMNEIVNNLGGFVNRANPDLRVRVRPLEKLGSAEHAWLPQNAARVGATTKTGGRLWLAAR